MDQHPSSLNSSFSYAFTYDVFLSFRGSDTRYGFTGNLSKALSDKGIRTFIDDRELRGGDQITPSLLKAIRDSRIAIPIFSANYASSSFCLDELANIVDCVQSKGRLVLPVFYNVDPSHVRHQTGTYGEALAKHEGRFNHNKKKSKDNMERLHKWKTALHQVANLSGYHYKHGDGYEHEFIGKIIEEVSKRINRVLLPIADCPVGLESQVHEVNLLLEVGSTDEVHMVGIHGMGGSGKTTLALAVYNSIADHFEGICFLENVRENSYKHGLQHLQSILLCEILGEKDIKLTSVRKGMSMIKHRLQRKKVLLILDDVDKQEHLQAIVGEPNWFGPGSRVIITTRDKHLVACHKIERTFEVKNLDKDDALQLLRWKAFKSEQVDSSYLDVLDCVVTYASGLPLALEVIGSNLYGKSIEEWESALNKYSRIPNYEILEILKISYDALEEEEKSVFLDIACCFKGYHSEEINDILSAHHGDNMKHHIGVLVDKSLVKINSEKEIKVHDLIEKMGKEIVRQESPKELGKRSRLWFHEDIVQVLEHAKGSNQIEMIFLQFPFCEFPFCEEEEEKVVIKWDGDGFENMENLKTLVIKNGNFSNGPRHLPNSLRVLEWIGYPWKDLPSDYYPRKLLICKLPNNCLSMLALTHFLSRKEFASIIHLNFGGCRFLTEIPDVTCLESLESLSISGCMNLRKIHDSVGSLKKLKILNARGCNGLSSFPPLVLTSLEWINLSKCRYLESFPEIPVRMEKMKSIQMEKTLIQQFPRSFRNLTELQSLYASTFMWEGNVGSSFIESIAEMPKLTAICVKRMEGWEIAKESEVQQNVRSSNVQILHLKSCKIKDDFFLLVPTWFANVKELYLRGENLITIVPECIKECLLLETLVFDECSLLQEIQGIPSNLKYFRAYDCPKLSEWSRRTLLKKELHQAGNRENFVVPLTPIPEWMDHHGKGHSVSFWFRNNLPHLLLCLALPEKPNKENIYGVYSDVFFNGIQCYDFMVRQHYTSLFNVKMMGHNPSGGEVLSNREWNFLEFKFTRGNWGKIPQLIIESGIHVPKQGGRAEDIRFTNPYEEGEIEDEGDQHESQDQQLEENNPQHMGFWSRAWNHACNCFPFLPAPPMHPLDDNVKEDSRSLASTQKRDNTNNCSREIVLYQMLPPDTKGAYIEINRVNTWEPERH